MLHREARAQLNKITTEASHDAADVIYQIYDKFRWREYISLHTQYDKIIGCGITAAHLETIANTRDPNRAGSARVDYVIYRADNTCCRVHPGNKPQNDAQLYFADISSCYRALQVHEVQPANPMTFRATMQIPMNDKIGKAEAWRQLSERDTSLIDVTEHDPFKWWLFLSNLGDKTEKAFGDGITSVQVRKQENRIGLRTEHTDCFVQWVILTAHRNIYKTHLATSFEESQ